MISGRLGADIGKCTCEQLKSVVDYFLFSPKLSNRNNIEVNVFDRLHSWNPGGLNNAITKTEVKRDIKMVNNHKACGIDELLNEFLKI